MDPRHHLHERREARLWSCFAHVGRIDPLEHHERRAQHRCIRFTREHAWHRHRRPGKRIEHARLAQHVVRLEDPALPLDAHHHRRRFALERQPAGDVRDTAFERHKPAASSSPESRLRFQPGVQPFKSR
jgi:hypothetical protein